MRNITITALLALILVASCDVTPAVRTVVKGTGQEEFLKLRAGAGLGFSVILGLPEGTLLTRHTCVTEVGQLWCQVSLGAAPGITGYVSADYLSPP